MQVAATIVLILAVCALAGYANYRIFFKPLLDDLEALLISKQRDQFERKRQPQGGFTLIEALIVAAIVAIIVILVIGYGENRRNFERACEKTGGETVWDGRQYQCLKRQPHRDDG